MAVPPGVSPDAPVVVGVGQFIQRPDVPTEALEPLAMMAEAAQRAAADAGASGLLAKLTHTWVVKGAWPYTNPAALLNERFGATARTGLSADGGNTPQALINKACVKIAAGDAAAVLIVGAEGIWSRRRARRANERIPYTSQSADEPNGAPDELLGKDVSMNNEVELERGLRMPINLYPVFESAFRASRDETIDAHRDRLAAFWERFNQTSLDNPYGWVRKPMSAADIRNPSAENRMVGFPYTKAMNSNWDLDQAAALIICSAQAASDAGVPTDRWVFAHAGTDGSDTQYVSNRRDLHSSPAIGVAGKRAFELAGISTDDVAHVDLYSCFPSAVQISATELRLGLDRPLTVTGGMPFAGGPLNNYVTHSVATMTGLLRDEPGSLGLCSANGGYLTKHAFGIYSTDPPTDGFAHEDCQTEIDQVTPVELDATYAGPARLEGYTVMHGADGPQTALAAVRAPSGARQWATSDDPDVMSALMSVEHVGTDAEVSADFRLLLT